MFKTKNTGRAMAISAVIICVCFAMLLGTTFAWFTDSKETKVNMVKSGKLNVELLDEAGTSLVGEELKFIVYKADGTPLKDSNDNVIEVNDLWEPGGVYATEKFTVKNAGNLALTFKFEDFFANIVTKKADETAAAGQTIPQLMDAIETDANGTPTEFAVEFKLYEVTDTGYVDSGFIVNNKINNGALNPRLLAGETKTYIIVAEMSENAGNDFQECSIEGMAVTVFATQAPHETDSRGDATYDAAATGTQAP